MSLFRLLPLPCRFPSWTLRWGGKGELFAELSINGCLGARDHQEIWWLNTIKSNLETNQSNQMWEEPEWKNVTSNCELLKNILIGISQNISITRKEGQTNYETNLPYGQVKAAVKIIDKWIHTSYKTNGGTEKLRVMDTDQRRQIRAN